ncbi:MAG: hypothetical protein WCO84_05315 [bacterium]
MLFKKMPAVVFFVAFWMFFLPNISSAAPLTWDNGAGNMQWNTSSANWSGSVWNNSNIDSAIFDGVGAGTVSITTPITVGNITFTSAGFVLGNGTTTLSGTPTITTNADASIASIAGTGFVRAGSGTLTMTASSTFLGNITV